MPTLDAFLAAADRFSAVAVELGSLAGSLHQIDGTSVVVGGRLGADVPESIERCRGIALACAQRVLDAEATCRQRAAVIVAYEAELLIYEQQLGSSQASIAMWVAEFHAWADSGGMAPYPYWEPAVPVAPAAPPAWADVRRP